MLETPPDGFALPTGNTAPLNRIAHVPMSEKILECSHLTRKLHPTLLVMPGRAWYDHSLDAVSEGIHERTGTPVR